LNTDGRSGDEVVELILQRINHWSPSTN
jgi:hypothetical protein